MTSSVEVKSAEEEHGNKGTLVLELATLTEREDSQPTSLQTAQNMVICGSNMTLRSSTKHGVLWL